MTKNIMEAILELLATRFGEEDSHTKISALRAARAVIEGDGETPIPGRG